MKTLVRITDSSENGFNFKSFQIIHHPWKDSNSIEVLGYIKFQQTKGEDSWYAMKFIIETSDVSHIEKMAKLAKFIKANSNYDRQPDEILNVIGAVEYKIFKQDFIEASREGENLYDVIAYPGSLHSRIIAPNDIIAQKILDKKKMDGAELRLNAKIVF